MSRTTKSSAKRDYHPESSWRMVEGGENDSFDTSILHDDEDFILSSGSQQTGSQPFSIGGSQPWSIGGSQDDNIENFLNHAEEPERVLLRTPFRPSVPESVRQSSTDGLRRQPDMEFHMPRVDVDSPERSSIRSSTTTLRATAVPQSPRTLRRRQGEAAGDSGRDGRERAEAKRRAHRQASLGDRASTSLATALFDAVSWVAGLIGLSLRYARRPLAILVSLYIILGGLVMLQNFASKPFSLAISPICRMPGVSWLDLSVCPNPRQADDEGKGRGQPLQFDSLMNVQGQFERVYEKAARGAGLPLEIRHSQSAINDLRTLVKFSSLPEKDALVLHFDEIISAMHQASWDLTRFNAAVGGTVDLVISMTRLFARQLTNQGTMKEDSFLEAWGSWLFSPFQPTLVPERQLLDRYVLHTTRVQARIEDLVSGAREVLQRFNKVELHLGKVHEYVTSTQISVQKSMDETLGTLWTFLGRNNKHLRNLNGQLALLRRVNAQRSDIVKQLTELLMDLQKISAELDALKNRVAESGMASGILDVPLSVHIETITRGLERLEAAWVRIQAEEESQRQAAYARSKGEGMLIDAR